MTNANFTSGDFKHNLIDDKDRSQPIMIFQTRFTGMMEMYSDQKKVSEYLNDHQGWFVRCAEPMKVIPFGDHGYTLIIGNYGAFGYSLEPQMTVVLERPNSQGYSMYSISNPKLSNLTYEVNYRSDLNIQSVPVSHAAKGIEKVYRKQGQNVLPENITKINWQLDLSVNIQFPSFIYRLPMSMIQSTGSRLLAEIVKQISPRLSYKVQKDFHHRLDLPIPPASSRTCQHVDTKLR